MSTGRRKSTTTPPPAPSGEQDPKRVRSEVLPSSSGGGADKQKGSSSSAAPAPVALVRDLTVEEHVLECIVCYNPLKPPIFQCAVGHVLCSPCSEKLRDARKCHVCGVAMADGYRRCHAMEDVLSSIRGPCPHAPYGCDETPVYHALREHLLRCPHAPCRCPGRGGGRCGFVGSLTGLVDHLAAAHGSWPCTAESSAGVSFRVSLRDGYNFLTALKGRGSAKCLLLLNMVTTPFGRAISAVSVGSSSSLATTTAASSSAPVASWYLKLTWQDKTPPPRHYQSSLYFQVEGPFDEIPDPNSCFQFFIPKYAGGSYEATTVQISARITHL